MLKLKLFVMLMLMSCGWFAWCLAQTRADDPVMEPMPTIPAGVDVQTRGPVHEAFASPTTDPQPSPLVQPEPPAQLDKNAARGEAGRQRRLDRRLLGVGRRSSGLHVGERLLASQAGSGREWVPGYWHERGRTRAGAWVAGSWGKTETNGNLSRGVLSGRSSAGGAPKSPGPAIRPLPTLFTSRATVTWVDAAPI